MINLPTKAVAVAAIATAIVAGSAAVASASAHRSTISVHTTSKHGVSAPNTTAPGLVRLHVTTSHPVWVLKKEHKGISTLVSELTDSTHQASPGKLISDFTVFDLVGGKSYVYLRLSAGTYYLADGWLDSYKSSEIHTLTVKGKTVNMPSPASSRVGVDPHNVLTAPKTLSTSRYLHIVNDNSHLQEILLVGVGTQVSDATVQDFLAKPTELKLFENLKPRSSVVSGIVAAHHALLVYSHQPRGRYVVVTMAFAPSTSQPKLNKARVALITVK
jgi:hypothetical protein